MSGGGMDGGITLAAFLLVVGIVCRTDKTLVLALLAFMATLLLRM